MSERDHNHHFFSLAPQFSMEIDQRQEMEQIMQWEQLPFLVAQGTEVLENMRTESGDSGEIPLEEKYIDIRNQILTPPFSKTTFIAAFGRNSAAKGGLNMGLSRMMRQDQFLQTELEKHNVKFELGNVLFSSAQEAAKLPEVGLIYDEHLESGQFSATDYRLISQFQWDFIEENIINKPLENTARVTFVEAACPTVYPLSQGVPMVVGGVADRGTSVIYQLLVDERTKDNTFVFAIKRDERVGDVGVETRKQYDPYASEDAINTFFDSSMKMVFRGAGGVDNEAKDLDLSEKRGILFMLKKFSASPQAKERADRELDELEKELAEEKIIEVPDDEHYYAKLREVLGATEKNFAIVTNELMGGINTYDLSYYFQDNLIREAYPHILTFPKDILE